MTTAEKVNHIPFEQVKQLWHDATGHSWKDLKDLIIRYKERGSPHFTQYSRADEIPDAVLDTLISGIEGLESSDYPDSPERLYELVNERLRTGCKTVGRGQTST